MDPMDTQLSPWRKRSLILLMVAGFSTPGYLAARTYRDAPPIPARVLDPAGATLFTGQDIMAGQQIFLSHGLMENGSIWGHGAYLGPDLSNEYLQTMALDVLVAISTPMSSNSDAAQPNDPNELDAEVAHILKANRYEPRSDTLTFTEAEADSFRTQQQKWRDYFSAPDHNRGLTAGLIQNPAIRRDKRGGLIPAKL
jgi:nitric oxide reductase subunit B